MLNKLVIKNYALIRELEIEPSAHLNIVTGETGAGKSIMLGAVGLLLGNRADSKVLYDSTRKCIVEGTFNVAPYDLAALFQGYELDYEPVTIIRREIAPEGKSRAFVNDTPVNLEVLKALGGRIMDVHSQHDTLLLGREDYQVETLDALAQNKDVLKAYTEVYGQWVEARKKLNVLAHSSGEEAKELDYNSFLLKGLTECNLETIDQENWESELKELENAGEIKEKVLGALQILSGSEYTAENTLRTAVQLLEQAGNFSEEIRELSGRLHSSLIEVRELALELERKNERMEPDFPRMEMLKENLGKLYTMQQKHKVQSVGELMAIRDTLSRKVSSAENLDRDIEEQKVLVQKLEKELSERAGILTSSRGKITREVEGNMQKLLTELAMPHAVFKIVLAQADFAPNGSDQVQFLFSANKGIAPQPMRQVASGGEFSRLMLCIKYLLAEKTAIPTIVFDEIDTGISGEVALKVGRMLEDMSAKHQLIAISHLPQIASRGDRHFIVFKDEGAEKSISSIRQLTDDERVVEIARMIGGDRPSATALKNAAELMELR